MNRESDVFKKYTGRNPFGDNQGRNYSDSKVINEFYPTSTFWSLFNDQHEVLLGTRGSGKTFLLKMMRYSMLHRLHLPESKKIIRDLEYIAFYVPMNLEFVTVLSSSNIPEINQIDLFRFFFNCLLADSIITEILFMVEEVTNELERAQKNNYLAQRLNDIWFNDKSNDVSDLTSLLSKLHSLYYNHDIAIGIEKLPNAFITQIGSTLLSVIDVLRKYLDIKVEPTWIICIDEAEFLKVPFQKCINTVLRAASKRMVFKVATLPFYYKTNETLDSNVWVSAGNDYNYRVIDMKYDSVDFINVTNSLCKNRLHEKNSEFTNIFRLEDFVGTIGNDDQIDYFKEEEKTRDRQKCFDREIIEKDIICEFSQKRKDSAISFSSSRKPVYDKFAPIYFVRRMYKISLDGNSTPGWYAGSAMIRKIAQGNPRRFIQLMNDLFEKARKSNLSPKSQHEAIFMFSRIMCDTTQALEKYGPEAKEKLEEIAKWLQNRVHDGPLIYSGNTFTLKLNNDEFAYNRDWIELAIAYSRLIVDNKSLLNGINCDTKYSLANIYSAAYWIPMRAGEYPKITLTSKESYKYNIIKNSYNNGKNMNPTSYEVIK